jgi:hypothetical protein
MRIRELGLSHLLKNRSSAALPACFTVAPHLQIINYHGCFPGFVGI